MVDCEGISGIYDWEQSRTVGGRHEEGRAYMTADINALAEGLKEAGVDKIIVRDCHSSAKNVIWDKLTPLVDYYFIGSGGGNRQQGIEDCDGLILLGYHAMAGTAGAFLNHTWSLDIQNLWINGRKSGEMAMDAGIAGDHGKPIIMVSGDDKACAEARDFFPWVVTAEVKRGESPTGGFLLPQAKAHQLIRDKAKEAIKLFPQMKTYIVEKPITFRVEVTQRVKSPVESNRGYMRVIDNRTYEVTGDDMNEAVYKF